MKRRTARGPEGNTPAGFSQTTEHSPLAPGLYVVATPIGNLGDMTFRAVETLKHADLIACEDTRVTHKLLSRFGIATKTFSYHDHNESGRVPRLIADLQAGKRIALVSDAGTPLIADPGYRLVRAAKEADIPVFTVPGPNAAIAALSIAGLPTDRFYFAGFLPPKGAARSREAEGWKNVQATVVCYEAPQRLAAALDALADALGERQAAVARELTKLHEEMRHGTLAELARHYTANPPRGECVILIAPPVKPQPGEQDIEPLLRQALTSLSVRDAATQVAEQTGVPRHTVYQLALTLSGR